MSLSVEHVSFSYGSHAVLHDVSFGLKRGEFLCVLGPNGVGKSTLFRCILGRMNDYSGRILSQGEDIRTLSRREMARRLAYIPQIHRPSFGYAVLDTVLMGTARQISAFARPGKEQTKHALDALERVGAAHLADRDFTHLSGGEQQLVLIARALAQQAEILVMDEPTSALDYGNQLRTLQLVRNLADEGYSVLLSTHNPQHALTFSSSVLALCQGRVAAHGRAQDVLTPNLVSRLYDVNTAFADTPGGRVLIPMMDGAQRP